MEDDDEEENIFSHSNIAYRAIVADSDRRKKEREEKKKVNKERRVSGKRKSDEFEEKPKIKSESSTKRRRITSEDADKLLSEAGMSPALRQSPRLGRSVNCLDDDDEFPRLKSGPQLSKLASSPKKPNTPSKQVAVIDLGESSGNYEPDELYMPPKPQTDPIRMPEEEEEEDDDEFAELARQARARHQKQELQRSNSTQTPEGLAKSPTPGDAGETNFSGLPTPPLPDPTVQLFVSSEIPNTKPLIVHRKMSQRLQEIRKVWCQKQGFDEKQTMDVFLIHRMRKLYDVTTCKSLGLQVDADGNVTMKGAEGKEDVDKVHLQAVTEEIFQQLRARKAQEERKKNGMFTPEDAAEAGAADEQQAKKPDEPLIRLMLKAKGRDDFKLKVKPVSTCFNCAGRVLADDLHRPRRSLRLWVHVSSISKRLKARCSWSSTAKSFSRRSKSRTRRCLTWTALTCTLADLVPRTRSHTPRRHIIKRLTVSHELSFVFTLPSAKAQASHWLPRHAASEGKSCNPHGILLSEDISRHRSFVNG